jgi:hypothetical protein
MQRVQNNDFPTMQDHTHAYRLYIHNKISYEEYKDVWNFYIDVFEVSRLNKLKRKSRNYGKAR